MFPLSSPNNTDALNENDSQRAPAFLFGQTPQDRKRRHLSPGKSVHWSPLLVQESTIASRHDSEKESTKTLVPPSLLNGPPLRSMMDEPPPEKQLRKSDTSFRSPSGYPFTENKGLNSSSFVFSPNDSLNTSRQSRISISSRSSIRPLNRNDFMKNDSMCPLSASNDTDAINENDSQRAPAFLFGQTPQEKKRRHLSPGKSVHWSPLLVQESTIASRHDSEKESTKTLVPPSLLNGPPLRSMMDEPPPEKQLRKSDTSFRSPSGYSFTENKSLNSSSFVFSPNDSLNTSRQSRLSISSRSGMRPLNRNDFVKNDSLNTSAVQQKSEESFLEKFWSYIAPS